MSDDGAVFANEPFMRIVGKHGPSGAVLEFSSPSGMLNICLPGIAQDVSGLDGVAGASGSADHTILYVTLAMTVRLDQDLMVHGIINQILFVIDRYNKF